MIVDQLYDGVEPEKIVAITFTNKATEELLKRIDEIISKNLKELEKDSVQNEKQIAILTNALNNLYKMNVSTIHHFCNAILNENSYKAKISFDSKLIEEDEEEKRRNDFYNGWLKTLTKEKIKEISSSRQEAFTELRKTYNALCSQFDDVFVESKVEFDFDAFFEAVFELRDKIQEFLNVADLGSYAQKFYDGFENAHNDYGNVPNEELFNKYVSKNLLATIRRDIKLKGNKRNSLSKEDLDLINQEELRPLVERCVKLKELYSIFIDAKGFDVINKYAIEAWDAYKVARDRTSLCNNQLIYETHKLLSENEDIRKKLAKKYDVLFVDEFQDTDRYQNKFIMDLALAIDERKKNENKMTTSIVLVGDPKQSIYGFRGADFELYMKARDSFSISGLRNAINVFLPDNYRSNQHILKWVNDTYGKRTFYPGYNYKNMIIPFENEIPGNVPNDVLACVYSYNFNGTKKENKFSRYASLVKKIKEENKIYKRKNKDDILEPTEIKYSDFLILTTSHSEINDFIIAFNKAGIKTLVSGEFYLSSSVALGYLYRVLLYLLDKENNNKKLLGKNFNSTVYDESKLERIKGETQNYSPYGILLYLITNFEFVMSDFEESDKSLLITILHQVYEKVCFNNNLSSIEILDAFEETIHEKQDEELSLEPNEDAVRIMNVHKAKGLTSEIVIVADSGGFHRGDSCKMHESKIYLNNLNLFSDEKDKYDKTQAREKLRLEYVASTRAKQVMIFEREISEDQLFNRSKEGYDFSNLNEYHIGNISIEDDILNEDGDIQTNAKRIYGIGIEKIDQSLKEIRYKETSPSSFEKSGPKSEFKTVYLRPANNIFGTAFHRVMELFVANRNSNLDSIIERAIKENILDISSKVDEYRKYLKECANAVIKLYEEEKIFDKYDIFEPEYKFCDYDKSLYGETPSLMTGSIDLLLEKDGKVLIVDYKTDTNHFENNDEFEKALTQKYSEQLNVYKKIINKCKGISNENIELKIVWLEEKDDKTFAHFKKI